MPHELLGVELDAVAVVARRRRNVLEHEPGLPQGGGQVRELRIHCAGRFERRRGRVQAVERAAVGRERLVRECNRGGERLRMLGDFQVVLELLVLALDGRHLVDAPQVESRLVELGGRKLACCLHARQLVCRLGGALERRPVFAERCLHRLARPRVEHLHVGCRAHELLVLELPAQVNRGRNALGELAHAGHGAVDRGARAPVGPHAAYGDQLVARCGAAGHEAPRHHERAFAVAHKVGAGPRAHEQFQGREERRLPRARLARDDGEAVARLQGGIAD